MKKRAKYACLTATVHSVPIAVETLGSLGEEADSFIHDLGRRITTVTGERRATEFLLQRLSVTIQSGNAASVLGTVNCQSNKLQVPFSMRIFAVDVSEYTDTHLVFLTFFVH